MERSTIFFNGKLTIPMAIFNSYMLVYQRVQICSLMKPSWNSGGGQRPGLVSSDCRAGHLPCCGSSGFNVWATERCWEFQDPIDGGYCTVSYFSAIFSGICTIDMQNVTKKSSKIQIRPRYLTMSISGRECLTHQLWDSVTCLANAWRLDPKNFSESLNIFQIQTCSADGTWNHG